MHFKKIYLMLKNSFKNATKSKTQLIGVTVLAFLLSLVLTLVVSMNVRVLEKYNQMNEQSRIHDAVIDLNPNDKVTTGENEQSEEAPKNLIAAQQYWLYKLQEKYYEESSELQFQWSRTEAREFAQVKQNNNDLTIKAIAKTTQNNNFNNTGVDKLVIFEGTDIQTHHQVVIDPNYAKNNGIKICDVIRIQSDNLGDSLLVKDSVNEQIYNDIKEIEKTINKIDDENGIYNTYYSNYQWFQVVGFGSSADFMAPIFNASTILPSRSKEVMLYVSPDAFGLKYDNESNLYNYNMNANGNLTVSSDAERESFYSIKFTETNKISNSGLQQFETDFKELIRRNSNNQIVYGKEDPNYRFSKRVTLIQKTIKIYTLTAFVVFILILFVCLYTISLITKKQIEKASKQLGTMKALGYRKRILVLNFVMLSVIASTIGGLLGYIVSISVSNTLTNEFANYFSLNYSAFDFDWISIVTMILTMWIILSAISFGIASLLIRKSSLSLISASFNEKTSAFKARIRSIQFRKTFGAKLRKALLVDAFGKMMAIAFVVLLSSILFTVSFAAPDILKRNQTSTYTGIKYKQVVEYAEPSYNNPLTFAKTFNPSTTQDNMVYSDATGGWTSLKLNDNGNFDYDQIMTDYFNNEISEKYYSIFIQNLFTPSSDNEYAIPNIIELSLANMKLLNLEGSIFDSNYFKQLSKYGIPAAKSNDQLGKLISPIILKQWFDYQNLFNEVGSTASLYEKGAALQSFYAKYSNSIGLSITNDFRSEYNQTISDEQWVKMTQNEKINVFNQSTGELANTYLTENIDMLKQLLNLTENENPSFDNLTGENKFKFTDGNYEGIGQFRIASNHNTPEAKNDYYLGLNFDKLSAQNDDESKEIGTEAITDMWAWFTFLFNNRVDQSIIQSAFSRPPYFVKQALINAFNSTDKNYSMAFNLVSYDPMTEAIGTKIKAEKNGYDFKIYGINNDDRFLDLRDTSNNNLIEKLFSSDEKNGIIINESLAKLLNLKVGEEVDFNLIQNELQDTYKDEVIPYELNDWDTSSLWNGTGGFKQNSRTNSLGANIVVKKPGINQKKTIDFLTSISSPTNYYSSVLKNETILGTKTTNSKFKIVGIHEGYGSAQAWIKNEDAKKVLQYDQVENYLWKNFFAKQWNKQFGYTNSFNTEIIIEDKEQEELKKYKKIKNLDLTKNGLDDLDLFKNQFIYHPDSQDKKDLGELILQVFENQYPVFNYKYSNKTDVADFNTVMSVSNAYGDYSPTALNGLEAKFSSNYTAFDGSGIGTVEWILPIDLSKEMLEEISQLILLLISIAIVLILSLTFVIILLTTSVIITDNIRFISTMRVLGYHDAYVVKTVMGMYFIVISTMFAAGFAAGWFIFVKTVNIILLSGIVLPLTFPIWLPILVFIGIVGIYLIAIFAGYKRITKTNSVLILQNADI